MSSINITTESIEFPQHGEIIRGTLYLPQGEASTLRPAVVLTHGWAMTAGGDLEDYAAAIAAQGIVCLTMDFRYLGASTGTPRQHLDPFQQIEDIRSGIDFLQQRAEVDPERIGIWGSSYSGGHALSVSAIDPRVKAAVSQVPTISGYRAKQLILSPEEWQQRVGLLAQARLQRENGVDTATIQTSSKSGEPCAYTDQETYDYMHRQKERCPLWKNYTTVASLDLAQAYEPGAYVYRITHTALLMVIASDDRITPTSLQQEAFAEIPSPNKKLLTIEGGHYSVYEERFDEASRAAAQWFADNL